MRRIRRASLLPTLGRTAIRARSPRTRTARNPTRNTGRRWRASTTSTAIAISFAAAFRWRRTRKKSRRSSAPPDNASMRVLVLGAGVVGVTAAWYLANDGHDVTVIDRESGVARETSFANGGQVSASYPEPWANPGAPRQILKWLGRDDAPLLFRL